MPGIASHKLEDLARELGIDRQAVAVALSPEILYEMELDPADASFHDARVDVLFLHLIFQVLRERLNELHRPVLAEMLRLLPRHRYILSSLITPGIIPASLPVPLQELLQKTRLPDLPSAQPVTFSSEEMEALFVLGGTIQQRMVALQREAQEHGDREELRFEDRPRQREMAGLIAEALAHGVSMMIEAPTGTGKTLAYLVPALFWARHQGRQVVVSTSVKNLQDQLVRELERLEYIFPDTFRYQVLKGRVNYVSPSAWDALRSQVDNGFPESGDAYWDTLQYRLGLVYLLRWMQATRDGTLDELHFWFERTYPGFAALKAEVAIGEGGGECPDCDLGFCFYHQALTRAREADLLVINHALLLTAPWGEAGWPLSDFLIADEGHNLEDACTTALTEEVSWSTIHGLANRLQDPRAGRGLLLRLRRNLPGVAQVQKIVRELLDIHLPRLRLLSNDFGQHLRDYVARSGLKMHPRYGAQARLLRDPRRIDQRWAQVDRFRVELQSELEAIASRLEVLQGQIAGLGDSFPFAPETRRELQHLARLGREQARLFDEILSVRQATWVYWTEVMEYTAKESGGTSFVDWALKKAPLRVGPQLQEKIYNRMPVVLTSATLTTAEGQFDFFRDRLGLESVISRECCHQIASEFPYDQNAFLVLAEYLEVAPRGEDLERFKEYLLGELKLLFRLTGGRALGLFTARDRMEYVTLGDTENSREGLEAYLGRYSIPVLYQAKGLSRQQLREDFKERVESVLLGLKSFWEGIDVPGKSLSFVVMEKLPFPMMGTPLIQARAEEYLQDGQVDRFTPYILPLMLIQFKQGFGRLIRKRDDFGVVILCDKGIHRKSYKPELLASLPGYYRPDTPDRFEADRRRTYEEIVHFMRAHGDSMPMDDAFWPELPEALRTRFEERMTYWTERLTGLLPMAWDAWPTVRPIVLEAMRDLFGPRFADFKSPEQEEAIRAMLTEGDLLALMPTGGGKSLVFQLPALLRQGLTLVISPLIALMRDQVEQLHALGIEAAACITSGMRAEERERIMGQVIAGRVRLLYVSPERLRDPKLIDVLRGVRVRQLVIDEAHCIVTWGTDFRPDYLYVYDILERMGKRPPVAALTATATQDMQATICERLHLRDPRTVLDSFDRPELKLVVYNKDTAAYPIRHRTDKLMQLLKILRTAAQRNEIAIVYVARTGDAEQLARLLRIYGINALPYHGKMAPPDRRAVEEEFQAGTVDVVVATKAFGLGINKADVRYVVHYDMPGDLESYYQEVGRAGRDGRDAYGVMLYHPADRRIHDYFIRSAVPQKQWLEALYAYLRRHLSEPIYFNPDEALLVLDEQGEMDETKLKVMLHLLEEWDYLRREQDYTRRAAVTVNRSRRDFLNAVAHYAPGGAALAEALLAQAVEGVPGRFFLDLPALARALDRPILEIEDTLNRWDRANLLVFRSFERGYIIWPTQRLRAEPQLRWDMQPMSVHQAEKEAKLGRMIAYAETLSPGLCRKRYVLHYFGEQTEWMRCGACDHCPPLQVPWGSVSIGELPKISDYVDPASIILEAHHWNVQRAARLGRLPKSNKAVERWLVGDDWYGVPDDFPYFEVLAQLEGHRPSQGRLVRIQGLTQRLLREGYLVQKWAEAEIAGQHRTWTYCDVTPAGEAMRGTAFGWE
jgi:ATP-dependent DNA helicase RecQ